MWWNCCSTFGLLVGSFGCCLVVVGVALLTLGGTRYCCLVTVGDNVLFWLISCLYVLVVSLV